LAASFALAHLASTLQWDPANPPTRWQRLRRVLHLGDLARVPGKLAIWASALPALQVIHDEQTQTLVDSLQALPTACKSRPRTPQRALRALLPVSRGAVGLQDIFAISAASRPRILPIFGRGSMRWERKSDQAVAGEDQASISTRENENSIRLLGAFRGVSEELVNFARQSGGIDWARLREARF
jgi:hypothetical protein